MSLTWNKENAVKPIAKVTSENKEWHGRILYISDLPPKPLTDGDKAFNILGIDYFRHGRLGRTITKQDIQWIKHELSECLLDGKKRDKKPNKKPRLDDSAMPKEKKVKLEKLVDQAVVELKKRHGRSITLPPDANFIPICNTVEDQRDCVFIFGPSGSGKSVFCRIYGKMWRKMHPQGKIYLVSMKQSDPNLDALDVIQIPLDESLIKSPIEIAEVAHSLVIFDDYSAIDDPALKKAVKSFQDKLLHLSRQDGVDVLITTHVALGYQQTKNIQGDATAVVGFPHAGAWREMEEVLRKYIKMSKSEMERIQNVQSRWCLVEKVAPCYVLTETEAWITQ